LGGCVPQKGSRRLTFFVDQITRWKEQGADSLMIPGMWRLYALLSGTEHAAVTTSCPSWELALGAHLWYHAGGAQMDEEDLAGLRYALATFEETLRVLPASCTQFRPQRPQSLQKAYGPCDDLRYNLIREAAVDFQGDTVLGLDTVTYSNAPLDAWLGWSVALFMSTVRSSDPGIQRHLALLTLQLVFELEVHCEWESALRVARFLADEDVRKRTTLRILAYVDNPTRAEELAVPRQWVWEAVALREATNQDHIAACDAWLRAGNFTRCARTIAEHIALPAILDCATPSGDRFVTGMPSELIYWMHEILNRIPDNERNESARRLLAMCNDMMDGHLGVDVESLDFPPDAWNNIEQP